MLKIRKPEPKILKTLTGMETGSDTLSRKTARIIAHNPRHSGSRPSAQGFSKPSLIQIYFPLFECVAAIGIYASGSGRL